MHWIIIGEAVLAGGLGLWVVALRADVQAEAVRRQAADAETARHAAHAAGLVEQLEAERARTAAVGVTDGSAIETLLADLAECRDVNAALARARRLLGRTVRP